MILLALVVSVSIASLVAARALPALRAADTTSFKNMVKNYFRPVVTGWGIGINTEQDSYLAARFHAVTIKTLSNARIREIIREAKAGNETSWTGVRNRLQAALDDEGSTKVIARVNINKVNYILTGIVRNETYFKGTIREKPDYSACTAANTSTEDCELQATQVGELWLTRKEAEFEGGRDRIWAGRMEFNETDYIFVALVNPKMHATVTSAGKVTPIAASVAATAGVASPGSLAAGGAQAQHSQQSGQGGT